MQWEPETGNVLVYDYEIITADVPQDGFCLELGFHQVCLEYSWERQDGSVGRQVWLLDGGKVIGKHDADTMLLPGESYRRYHLQFEVDTAFSVTIERSTEGKLTMYLSARRDYGGTESLLVGLPYTFAGFSLLGLGNADEPELVATECGFGPLNEATGRVTVSQWQLKKFKWNMVAISTQKTLDGRLQGIVSWNKDARPQPMLELGNSVPRSSTIPPLRLPQVRWHLPSTSNKPVVLRYGTEELRFVACEFACRWTEKDGTRRIQTWRFRGQPNYAENNSAPPRLDFVGKIETIALEDWTAYRLTPACGGIQAELSLFVYLNHFSEAKITFEQAGKADAPFDGEFWLLPQKQADTRDNYRNKTESQLEGAGTSCEGKIVDIRFPEKAIGQAVCVKVTSDDCLYSLFYDHPVTLAQLAEGYTLCPDSAPLLEEPADTVGETTDRQLESLCTESGPMVVSLTVGRPGYLIELAYFDGRETHIVPGAEHTALAEFDRMCDGFSFVWLGDGSLQIDRRPGTCPSVRLSIKWDSDPAIQLLVLGSGLTKRLAVSSVSDARELRLQANMFGGMIPSLFGKLGEAISFPGWSALRTKYVEEVSIDLTRKQACPEPEGEENTLKLPITQKTPVKTMMDNETSACKEGSVHVSRIRIDSLIVEKPSELSALKFYAPSGKLLLKISGGERRPLSGDVEPFILEDTRENQLVIRCQSGSCENGKAVLEYFRYPSTSFKLRLLAVVTGEDSTAKIELPYVEPYRYGMVTLQTTEDGGLILVSANTDGEQLTFDDFEVFKRAEREKAERKEAERKQKISDVSVLQERCQKAETDLENLRAVHLELTKHVERLLHVLEGDEPSSACRSAQEQLEKAQLQLHEQNGTCAAVVQQTEQMQRQLSEISEKQREVEAENKRVMQEQEELSRRNSALREHQAEVTQLRQKLNSRIGELLGQGVPEIYLQADVQVQITEQLAKLRGSWEDTHGALQELQEQVRRAVAERDEILNHSNL